MPARGSQAEARPWETVGGVGFGGGGAQAPAKPAYVKPKGRADLTPGSAAAVEAAEACNDEAVKAFKASVQTDNTFLSSDEYMSLCFIQQIMRNNELPGRGRGGVQDELVRLRLARPRRQPARR